MYSKSQSVVRYFSHSFLQDGEQVEFDIIEEGDGRTKATNVTGPDGAVVKGAQRRSFGDDGFNNDGFGNSGGFGGGNDVSRVN